VPDTIEEQLLIPSGAGTLSGVLYVPQGVPSGAVLFCNPLFEERKSSQRVMVECARALCRDGLMVLRFDYRGCGDSSGNFKEFVPSDWMDDISNASKLLSERAGKGECGVLGLRLGANLAVRSTIDGLSPGFLILWEPVVEGNSYIEHELRRKGLREMVTSGKGRASRQASSDMLASGESVDLDGYELTPALFKSIKELSLGDDLPSISKPLFIANITHSDEPSAGMAPIRDLLQTPDQVFEVTKEQPFWNRIGLIKCPELLEKTRTWIRSSIPNA
jgi:exosortase A-associated hydrolase 2